MKNLFDEMSKLSMADDDDYDEYEEEVIERDEEYDDEDEEEYDDEEYDEDEDYDDDEEYDDEDEDEDYEEEYDDGGYEDYDSRLDQVLDELAELKRTVNEKATSAAPAPVVMPQTPPPAYPSAMPHLLFSIPNQQNNEVVMYNEISRLRDELAKTQNEQSMHVELSRLKEEMERDKKLNEAQFLAEIKRLNERIEELSNNNNSRNNTNLPNNAPPANGNTAESPRMPAKELNKLITINENLLHGMADSDAKIVAEIGELKSRLEAINSAEIMTAVDEIRVAVKSIGENPVTVSSSEGVSEQIAEKVNACVAPVLDAVTVGVETLKTSLEESLSASPAGGNAAGGGGAIDKKFLSKLSRLQSGSADVDLTEVMRSVYELKGMLGSNDANQRNLVNLALKAYTELDLLHATIANSPDFRSKLEAIDNFVSTVNEQDFITSDALSAFNIVIKEVMDTPLDRKAFDAVSAYAATTGKITIPNARKEAISKYISFAERVKSEELDSIIEFLPDMVSALNDAEGGRNLAGNSMISDSVSQLDAARKASESDTEKLKAESEIRDLIADISEIKLSDVVSYTPVMPLPTSDAIDFTEGESVSDRLNSLIETVNDLSAAVAGMGTVGTAASSDEEVATEVVTPEITEDGEVVATAPSADLENGLAELKAMLVALEAKVNIDDALNRIYVNLNDIAGRLSAIDGAAPVNRAAETDEYVETVSSAPEYTTVTEDVPMQEVSADISDSLVAQANDIVDRISEKIDTLVGEDNQSAVLEDLAQIKEKLADHEAFLSQINELRADILAIPDALHVAEQGDAQEENQFDKLYDDISAQIVSQCDKLYEDLTSVEGETADKLAAEVAEIKAAVESITASDLTSTLLDTVVDFRTSYEESRNLSDADRTKILEDIAYVREQVEAKLATQAEDAVGNSELSAQIEELGATFAQNMSVLEEKIAALSTDEVSVTEQQILDGQSEILAAISEIKERTAALEDSINTNGLLAADNSNTVTEDLNRIIEQLTPPANDGEQVESNVYDEIVAISDKVDELGANYEKANGELLAAIADVKEQIHLKELEQDLETVAATEEEQKALLTEIAALRERLGNIESAQSEQAEQTATQLGAIIDQVTLLGEQLTSNETDADNAQDDAAALDMQLLISDIAEIKEKLGVGTDADSDFVRMQDDLTFIRNQIEANMEGDVVMDDGIAESLQSEDISLIMDDIATIKEKLATFDEYDTVSEILSLREDVKAARILDNNDIAAELEGLKGDLLELKADISDIKALKTDESVVASGEANLTSDEVNMILTEIVSLRDEIQDYRDDIANAASATEEQQEAEPSIAVADESIAVILDELAGIHGELADFKEENQTEKAAEAEAIRNSLAELKDMISRRTSIAEESAGGENVASNELNVVLDEVINVKDEVAALKESMNVASENEAAERESDALAAKSMFADELQVFKNELYSMVSQKLEELSSLQSTAEGGTAVEKPADNSDIANELAEIKKMLSEVSAAAPAAQPTEDAVSVKELYDEVLALREDMKNIGAGNAVADGVDANAAAVNESLLSEVLALREEITELRNQVANAPVGESAPNDAVLGEVIALREELAALKEQGIAAHHVSDDASNNAILGEIFALRDEIHSIHEGGAHAADEGLAEAVDAIREDVRVMKEEPDLSFINEVLALRDEFQAFKDEMNKTRTAPAAESHSKDEIMSEVQSLRDQLFAISMANVNDGTSGDGVYESYNNIILDEISALREEIALIKKSDESAALSEELAQMKDRLTNLAIDDSEKTESRFAEMREQIAELKASGADDATNNAILEELASLKQELANQREADATTLNFMSEMAHLLERQNVYIGQASDERLTDELENLKSELASSISASAANDDIRNELESIRQAIGRNSSEPAVIDNSAVLEELAAIRAELKSPVRTSDDSRAILNEITKLRNEIDTIVERPSEDGALSRSINDLKAELSQIAGYVDTDTAAEQPKPKKTGTASKAKSGSKSGAPKSGTRRKNTSKAAAAPASEMTSEELITKIDSVSRNIAEPNDNTLVMNPDVVYPATAEEMDIASRLAKQVANKLIMEQLVQQLGDGGVPHSEVEEIVKDIMPQEFTTIQIDEQTDKVRRLANSLVLDKLRNRLKK